MKRHLARTIATILMVVLILTAAPLNGFVGIDWPEIDFESIFSKDAEAATTASGTCGENLTWTLKDDGTLTIVGTGAMTDYDYETSPFYNNSNIKSVVFGNGVTSIGANAFRDCSQLTTVIIADSVTDINAFAFCSCSALDNVVIPPNVTVLKQGAFASCAGLKTITIPASVTTFEYSVFRYVELSDINYSGSEDDWNAIKKLGRNEGIGSATIHYAKQDIIDSGTCGENLTWTLDNDGTLTIAGKGEMENYPPQYSPFSCSNMIKKIIICEGVTSIGTCAFDYSSVTTVSLPSTVKKIELSAFFECPITSFTVDEENEEYASENGVLYNKDKSTLIRYPIGKEYSTFLIPQGVKTIGDSAFSQCRLKSIILPNSATTIELGAFQLCTTLSDLYISNNLTGIGDSAFLACNSLQNVYYSGSEEQWKKINIYSDNVGNDDLFNATIHYNYKNNQISIIANVPDLHYKKTESILLGVMEKSGNEYIENPEYTISMSDASVIELQKTDYYDNISSFHFIPQKCGETILTFTNIQTDASVSIEIVVLNDETDIFRCYEFNENNALRCCSGLYVEKLQCTDQQSNASNITFDVYNTNHSYGVAEVYGPNGEFIASAPIAPLIDSSGFELVVDSVKSIGFDIWNGDEPYYYDEMDAAKTSVNFSNIPHGSMIVLQTNSEKCGRVAFYNGVSIFISCLIEASTFSVSKEAMNKTVSQFAKEILASMPDSTYKSLTQTLSNAIAINSTTDAITSVYDAILNVCTQIGFDFKSSISDILVGLGYSAADTAIEYFVPAWKIVSLVGSLTSIGWHITDASYTLDSDAAKIYVTSHSKHTTNTLVTNGISIESTNGFTTEVLDVELYDGEITIELASGEILNTVPYEITIYRNKQPVNPNEKVKVMIPIPSVFSSENCGVLRAESDGTYTILPTTVENGYIIFETDHFSVYVLIEANNINDIVLKNTNVANTTTIDESAIPNQYYIFAAAFVFGLVAILLCFIIVRRKRVKK